MLIDDSIGLRVRKVISVNSGADRCGVSALIASARGAPARRTIFFGAFAIFLAAMAYIAAVYGFRAVARCEIETNRALVQSHDAISQIAMSSACGF